MNRTPEDIAVSKAIIQQIILKAHTHLIRIEHHIIASFSPDDVTTYFYLDQNLPRLFNS